MTKQPTTTKAVDTKVSNPTTTKKANKMKKATTPTPTKATKATTPTNDLKVSATFKKSVTQIVSANNAVNKANTTLETKSLALFNATIKEAITLKKEVIVKSEIKDINDYKYNQISKALKAVNKDSYYHGVIDTAIHYLKSGYSVMFLDTVKLSLIKKLIDAKPTKALVKKCKDNKELETLLNKATATNHSNKQTAIKAKLSTNGKKVFDNLSTEDIALIKAYFNA